MSNTLIVVAALIVRGDAEILISQRPPGAWMEGYWEFPGGKAEPGEEPRAALVRECREELGVEIRTGRIYETIFIPSPERPILLLFYLAEIVSGVPRPMENNPVKWVTIDDLPGIDIIPSDIPLIAELQRRFPIFEATGIGAA